METVDKIVQFDLYCSQCKYENTDEDDDPCYECLKHPSNAYSHKPVEFVEKE